MVNLIDRYPNIFLTINKFNEEDYQNLLKIIEKLDLKSKKSKKITINVDIFYLQDYSINCINKMKTYLDNLDLQSKITLNLYLDKIMNNLFLKSYIYLNNNFTNQLKINVIENEFPQKW